MSQNSRRSCPPATGSISVPARPKSAEGYVGCSGRERTIARDLDFAVLVEAVEDVSSSDKRDSLPGERGSAGEASDEKAGRTLWSNRRGTVDLELQRVVL